MVDDKLFMTGKVAATHPDGSAFTYSDGLPVLIDGPDRWKQLLALEFESALIDQMIQLSHYERLPLILEWYSRGDLSPDDLNRLLSDNWTHGGYAADQGWETSDWVELLEWAGFVTDTSGWKRPSEPLWIHRGARLGGERGMSWSTDWDTAAWFARRLHDHGTPAVLVSATIAPGFILAAFDDRNEHEVVIDPAGLDGVEIRTIDAASSEVRAGFERRNAASQERYRAFNAEPREG